MTTSPERPWLRGLVVAHATAAVLDDARQLATMLRGASRSRRSPAWTRAPSRGICARTACLRGIITEPGMIDPDAAVALARAVPRWEDQDFVAQVSPAAVREVGRRARRRRSSRSSTSGSRPTSSARCAGAACASASCRTRPPRPTSSRPDVDGVVLSPGPRRSGAARRSGRARPGDHRRRTTAAGDLPRPPGHRAGRRCGDAPAPVRPSRGEPPGPGPRLRPTSR